MVTLHSNVERDPVSKRTDCPRSRLDFLSSGNFVL